MTHQTAVLEEYVARADKVKDLTNKVKETRKAKIIQKAENFQKANEEATDSIAKIGYLHKAAEYITVCFHKYIKKHNSEMKRINKEIARNIKRAEVEKNEIDRIKSDSMNMVVEERISATEIKLAELDSEKESYDKETDSIRLALQAEKERGKEIAKELEMNNITRDRLAEEHLSLREKLLEISKKKPKKSLKSRFLAFFRVRTWTIDVMNAYFN